MWLAFPAYLQGMETSERELHQGIPAEVPSLPTRNGNIAFSTSSMLPGQFPAYLQGMETSFMRARTLGSWLFPAYLQGMETEPLQSGHSQVWYVPSLPTRNGNGNVIFWLILGLGGVPSLPTRNGNGTFVVPGESKRRVPSLPTRNGNVCQQLA